MNATAEEKPALTKVIAGFVLMFVLYQAAEGAQTVIAPGNPLGPALMVAALAIAWPIGRWLGGNGFDRFGLALTGRWWAVLLGGMLIAALAKLTSLAVGAAGGIYAVSVEPLAVPASAVAIALLSTFVPSVAEDILTRGFLLTAAPIRLNLWSFTLLSALLYTANHVWRFDWGITEQVRLFCLGLAYGAAAWRWRSLWGAVALHWGWNLTSVLADQVLALETANMDASRIISGSAHLLLLAIVLLWVPNRREVTA